MASAGSGDLARARQAIDRGLTAARREGLPYDEALVLEVAVDLGLPGEDYDPAKVTEIFSHLGVVA